MEQSLDSQRLLPGFLMEAWEGLAGLEQSFNGLMTDHATLALQKLKLLSHRMYGSAALYGFPLLARLAEQLESAAHQIHADAPERTPNILAFYETSLQLIPEVLDRITRHGDDEHPELAPLFVRYAKLQISAEDPSDREKPPESSRFAGIDLELRRFRQEHPDVLEYFLPEAEEHLETMGNSLSRLEKKPEHRTSIAALFRSIHTLKGAAFTVGCEPMGKLAHSIEDLMVEVRNDRRELDPGALDAMHTASDVLRSTLSCLRGAEIPLEAEYEATTRKILAWMEGAVQAPESEENDAFEAANAPVSEAAPDLEIPSEDPQAPGTASTDPLSVDFSAASEASRDAPAVEEVEAEPTLPAKSEAPAVQDSQAPGTRIRVDIRRMDRLLNLVGELVVTRRRFERHLDRLDQVDEQMTVSRSRMVDAVQDFETKYLNPTFDPTASGAASEASSRTPRSSSAAKIEPRSSLGQLPLDELFDELEFDRYDDFNILSRRVGEISADLREAHAEVQESLKILREEVHQLRQLTLDLRDGISRARMVPIGQLYGRFRRLLRKLEADSGKQLRWVTTGEAVEVDNAIIERIVDPLMHLIQNAVSHGIESPEQRKISRKPLQGTITLNAYPRGNFVFLEVEDDGAGIDVERLKQLALSRGHYSSTELEALDEDQALKLIYLPGLSTSTELTTAAGRGVGMDVVLNNISSLNGEIEIDTELGSGTRFTVKLPLTLLISEALIIRVGDAKFGIPSPSIIRLLHVRQEDVQHGESRDLIRVGEEEFEVLWLERIFGLPSRRVDEEIPIVLIRGAGQDFALAVDEHLVIEEIVIKSLGQFLEGLEFFAGATISGEGHVLPLLDTVALGAQGQQSGRRSTVAVADQDPVEAVSVESSSDGGILLVDDSLSVRKIVGSMLQASGLKVTTAGDGVEAIEAVREQNFDLVLTDLEMPRLNGYELIEHLRRLPETRSLPIVVITSRAGSKHFEVAQRLGATEYLTKPVDQEDLIYRVKALLPSQASEAEPDKSGLGRGEP